MTRGIPQALTLVIPARSGMFPLLKATLERWEEAIPSALAAARSVGHLGLCALPGPDGGGALLVETAFEGELERHLGELWGAIGDAFADAFATCDLPRLRNAESFVGFVRERASRVQAFYVAHPRVPEERPTAPSFAERAAVFAGSPLFELDDRVRRWFSEPSLDDAADEPSAAMRRGRSPFAAVFPLRSGRLRTNALRRALRFADSTFTAGVRFRDRGPGGLAALHTARFVLLPENRLLVTALVDGQTAVFFDRLSVTRTPALSAIFMHTEAFPKTSFGVFGGARRHGELRRWIRAFQLPPGIWYSSYPDLSR